MKSSSGLYLRIADPDNLRLAYLKAVRAKRDRTEVIVFGAHLGDNLALLRRQLLAGALDIGHYRFFTVRDPKMREICAASFAERVLHHAVMNVCEPVLERYAVFDSYACRKGKGHRQAVLRAQSFCRNYPWYLKLDIRKYFDSINHSMLLGLLTGVFRERQVVELFAKIFATYYTVPGKGLPIGNLVSQHCANAYLGLLDHRLKDDLGVKGYVRYMDDFLIFAKDRAAIVGLLVGIQTFLRQRLDLDLKDNIQINRSVKGIPFLGYRVFPDRIMLGALSKRRFIRKFVEYEQKHEEGFWDEQQLAAHMEPLVEFTRFAAAGSFRRKILKTQGVFS